MSNLNIGAIAEALNDKMDIDGGNSNPEIAHMSDLTGGIDVSQLEQDILELQNEVNNMPKRLNYSAGVSVSLMGNTGNGAHTYTCPANGRIFVISTGITTNSVVHGNTYDTRIYVNNNPVTSVLSAANGGAAFTYSSTGGAINTIDVNVGDTVYAGYYNSGTSGNGSPIYAAFVFTFVPEAQNA